MNHRDKAFEAFFGDLGIKDDADDTRDLLRRAWEAGRQYEVNRIDAITRSGVAHVQFPDDEVGDGTRGMGR